MSNAWHWIKLVADDRGERVALIAPYHPQLVAECKRRMGKFGAVKTKEGSQEKAWTLRAEHQEPLDQQCQALWPPPETRVERFFTYRCDSSTNITSSSGAAPQLDGLDLCRFERDQCSEIYHPDVLEVIEKRLRTGGSRAHPSLSGTLVIRAKVRPEATATWSLGETATYTPEEWKEKTDASATDRDRGGPGV